MGMSLSRFSTPEVRDNANPTWNYVGTISEYSMGDFLRFTVLDKDWFPPGKADDVLGSVSLEIAKMLDPDDGFDGELKLAAGGSSAASSTGATLKVKVEEVTVTPGEFTTV